VYSSKKPYQRASKGSTRFLNNSVGPESVFEKPYLQGEYGDMNQAPNTPEVPPGVGGYGGLVCMYSGNECEINAECYAGPEIRIVGGPEESGAGYLDPVATAGFLADWSIGDDVRHITLVLDPNQTRNIIEVTFVDGWGNEYTEVIDVTCAGPPEWLLVVNFTDLDGTLNSSLDTIIYDIAEDSLITGPDNEIWISPDLGVNWTEEATTAGYTNEGVHDPAHGTNVVLGYARRIYVSSNGGDTWALEETLAGLSDSDEIDAIIYDPVNENIIAFVGLSGDPDIEVWQSTDGGYNWTLKDTLTDTYGVMGATFDSDNDTILLLTGHRVGTSHAGEVWISDDGGDTWALKKDLKTDYSLDFLMAIAYDTARSQLIINARKATGNTFTWVSDDGGTTWSEAGDLGFIATYPFLVYSPSADKLYTIRFDSGSYIYSSSTGGASWTLQYSFSDTSDEVDALVHIPALKTTFAGTTSGSSKVKLWAIIE